MFSTKYFWITLWATIEVTYLTRFVFGEIARAFRVVCYSSFCSRIDSQFATRESNLKIRLDRSFFFYKLSQNPVALARMQILR